MSASREKKQRQSAGPDQKAVKAQQEQAARRRQTIIYSVVGGVIAVLVIALLVWRTGFFQARTAAAQVGGETLTAAELSYYYNGVRSSLVSYGIIDTTKADDEQIYNAEEGASYRDYFMEEALTSAQQYLALAQEAVNAGHTEAEVKEDLDAQIDSAKAAATANGLSYSAYLKALYGEYMTASIFEKLTTRSLMANLVAGDKYSELYDSYAQSELDAYYEEHKDNLDTVEYSYLYFAIASVDTKDAEGNELDEDAVQKLKDEAQADAKGKAEEALKAVEGGASFEAQAAKYELTTATNHGDHVTVVGTGSLNSAYSEQLLALDKDECDLVETDNGYYVFSFHDRYRNDEPTRDVRHIAILADTTTDDEDNVVAPTEEAWAAAKEKMDAIEAEWNAGEKTEDAFAALAEKYNTDEVGSDLVTRIPSDNTSLVPEFKDWVFEDHQPGDSGVIQHSAGDSDRNKFWSYHLMFYVGENEPVWKDTVRSTLASEAQTAWIEELAEAFPTTELSGANYFGK